MGKVKQVPSDDKMHPSEILRQNLKRSSTKITTKDGKVKKKIAKRFTAYKCNFCNKKFTDKYNCQSHEKIHSDNVFPCQQCQYKGKTKKYLARHMKSKHNTPTQHKCHVCGKMFHHKCNLNEHMMVHTGEKPHKCEICGKTFRVTYSLNSHMLIHTNEKPFKCSFCDYACRDSSTLRKHEHRHMGIVKTFTCKVCSKKFPDKAKLKYHISEIHLDYLYLDLKRVTCDKCDKTFRSKYNLNKHIQTVHDKIFACSCPVCGQRVSSKHNLPAHLRSHFDERPHACVHDGCGKRFKDKGTLKKHSIIHSPHLHLPCRTCGATFSRAHRLEAHMLTHQRREKCVECDYCGVTFYTKNYLIKHITQKHCAKKEEFICDLCGLVTYNKPSIVMHLKYGHKYKHETYCKICKTEYKRHIYLKAHYLKTHNVRYRPMKRCKKKERRPSVEVKVEPVDSEPFGEIQLLKVHKEEIIEEDDPNIENDLVSYSKHVLSEDLAECLLTEERSATDNAFDEFLYRQVFHKRIKDEEPTEDKVDEQQEMSVAQKIKEIIKNAEERKVAQRLEKRRKKEAMLLEKKLRREAKAMRRRRRREIYELEKVRQLYNERMKAAVDNDANKKEPAKKIKYFKKKTTENTTADKQTDQTNNVHNKDNSEELNDDCSRNKNNSNNENGLSNNYIINKVIDSTENNSNNVIANANNEEHSKDNNNKSCKDSSNKTIDPSNKNTNNDNLTNDPSNITKGPNYNKNSEKDAVDSLSNDKDSTTKCDGNDVPKDGHAKNDGENDVPKDGHAKNDGENDVPKDGHAKNAGENDETDDSSDDETDTGSVYEPNAEVRSDDEATGNKRLKFKTYQCYICFKLYPTKEELITHCSNHFAVCNTRTLVKCPVCGHVTHAHMAKHMLKKHGISVTIPFNKITDRNDNDGGSRYCYKIDDTVMEIIPSVKILNHNAAIAIDKRNRERKDMMIAKTKLVKKGKEWIVENVAVDISFEELPEIPEQELSELPVTNSYADRLGQLSRLAKKRGIRMMFPCDRCEKICQNFSALKLHGRRHDPNKKPFAPRKYKRNQKPVPEKKKPEVTNFENRHAKPQPIKNKHKCDDKLKKFYETHIRGADIEFWQFLKIFNKMDRENIQDFKDFEGRVEFGIHTNEDRSFNEPKDSEPKLSKPTPNRIHGIDSRVGPKTNIKLAKRNNSQLRNVPKSMSSKKLSQHSNKIVNRPQYKRVIMISKKQHLEREKAKARLREKLAQNS